MRGVTAFGSHRRVRIALGVGIAVVLAAVPALAGGAGSTTRRSRLFADREHGISLRYFDGWHVTNLPLNGIIDPVQRFVLSSYRITPGSASRDGSVAAPSSSGVVAQLAETEPPLPLVLNRLPVRPRKFTIPKLGRVEGFAGDRWGEIVFKEHRRAFYLFLGVGAQANRAARSQLLAALDTLVIAHARPSPEAAPHQSLRPYPHIAHIRTCLHHNAEN